jgi:hypothetical protein
VAGDPRELGHRLLRVLLPGPANRIGAAQFSTAQLKTIQEVITLVVFSIFSVTYPARSCAGTTLRASPAWSLAVVFVFRGMVSATRDAGLQMAHNAGMTGPRSAAPRSRRSSQRHRSLLPQDPWGTGVLRSLGLVFGDIGTGLIYTLTVVVALTIPTEQHILGILTDRLDPDPARPSSTPGCHEPQQAREGGTIVLSDPAPPQGGPAAAFITF